MQGPLHGLPDGWHRSPVDPARILALFPTLGIRNDLRLIAYQFVQGGNGNGIVLAWPKERPVPELPSGPGGNCSHQNSLEAHLQFHLKAGGWQVENYVPTVIMSAIEGDGSPRSYLEASIFGREIYEFGAIWHGGDWCTHRVSDRDPFTEGVAGGDCGSREFRLFPRDDWTVEKALPRDWSPTVTMTAKQARVEFTTHSGLGREGLYRHRDIFARGNYQCRTSLECLAWAPGGYVF